MDATMEVKLETEFLKTEANYKDGLAYLTTAYIEPIDKAMATEVPIISPGKRSFMFEEIPELVRMSEKLIHKSEKMGLAKAFTQVAKELQTVYLKYYLKYTKIQRIIKRRLLINDRFKEITQDAKQTIEDIMITPIQRVPRYQLLFEAILKERSANARNEKDVFRISLLRKGSSCEMLDPRHSAIVDLKADLKQEVQHLSKQLQKTRMDSDDGDNESDDSGSNSIINASLLESEESSEEQEQECLVLEKFTMLRNTPENMCLLRAYKASRVLASLINRSIQKIENENRLILLRQRLFGTSLEIPDTSVLLFEGDIYKIDAKKQTEIMNRMKRDNVRECGSEFGDETHKIPDLCEPPSECNKKKRIFLCTNTLIYADEHEGDFSELFPENLLRSTYKLKQKVSSFAKRNISEYTGKIRQIIPKKVRISIGPSWDNLTFFYTRNGLIKFSDIEYITKFQDDLIYVTKRGNKEVIFRSSKRDLWFERISQAFEDWKKAGDDELKRMADSLSKDKHTNNSKRIVPLA